MLSVPRHSSYWLLRYGLAIVLFAAAAACLRIPVVGTGSGSVVLVAYLATIGAAWYGGIGPGLLVLALCLASTWPHELTDERLVRIALFLTGGVLTTAMIGQLRSARRQAELVAADLRFQGSELREERDLVDAFLQTAACLVVVLDRDGRIVRFNQTAASVTGYAPDEVLCRYFWESLVPAEEVEDARGSFLDLVARGGTCRFEGSCRTRDGAVRRVDWSQAALRDEQGRVRYVVASGIDETDRRGSEERIASLNRDLSRRINELQVVLDVIPMGIGIAEDPECRTIRVNGYFARALGLSPEANASLSAPEEERPTNFRVVRDGRDVPPDELPLQVAAREGVEVQDIELEVIHEDGRVVTMLESAAPLFDEHGMIRGSVGAFLDISELKRARDELWRAKEAAEAANQAKGLFLAMLSHELRTPLAPALLAISGMLEDPRLTPELREPLETARRGILLEARLVDDLLDAMRADAGKLRIDREPLDAHAVLTLAIEACAADLDASGLDLVVELTAREHQVEADPARLQQVVWNLLKNAVKFTPQGGTITLRTRNEPHPDGPEARPRLLIEVADTGVGIEPEALARIFEPFAQERPGRPLRSGGLGLGLAISRAIVGAHGGSLSASSAGPGFGSTFAIRLDTIGTATRRSPRPVDEIARGAWPARVLLIEDDEDTARVLTRLLTRAGSEVTAVSLLAEARERLEGGTFDLVLSDVGLPDGSGWELLRDIPPGWSTPAIALTGFGTEDDIRRCREAGFAAHLTKPVDYGRLQLVIRRVISGRDADGPRADDDPRNGHLSG